MYGPLYLGLSYIQMFMHPIGLRPWPNASMLKACDVHNNILATSILSIFVKPLYNL